MSSDNTKDDTYVSFDDKKRPKSPRSTGCFMCIVMAIAIVYAIGMIVFASWGFTAWQSYYSTVCNERNPCNGTIAHKGIVHNMPVSSLVTKLVVAVTRLVMCVVGLIAALVLHLVPAFIFLILYSLVVIFDLLMLIFGIVDLANYRNETINSLVHWFSIVSIEEPFLVLIVDTFVVSAAISLIVALIKYRITLRLWEKRTFI